MSFHLYGINELYSNADGTVQFIELVIGNINFESFWQGHTITVTQAGTSSPPGYGYSLEDATNTFTFPSNLPSTTTANTSVLLATPGFANLGIVTPDFIIPSGFLFINGGTVNFGEGSDVVTYSSLPTDGISSINRSGVIGINSPKDFAGFTGTIPSSVIPGDDGPNNLPGTAGDDIFSAGGGNDTLTGGGGNDTLDGGTGLDTALFNGNLAGYTVSGAGTAVSGQDGNDTLSNIERLQFSDKSLAFDLDRGESAGNTVRLIGAAFGTQFLTPEIIGIVVDIFDAGYSLSELSPVALTVLGSPGNVDFVTIIFRNVVEIDPPPDAQAALVGLLDSGAMTQAQMLEIVANLELNETHIGLVGMQQNGVEFV